MFESVFAFSDEHISEGIVSVDFDDFSFFIGNSYHWSEVIFVISILFDTISSCHNESSDIVDSLSIDIFLDVCSSFSDIVAYFFTNHLCSCVGICEGLSFITFAIYDFCCSSSENIICHCHDHIVFSFQPCTYQSIFIIIGKHKCLIFCHVTICIVDKRCLISSKIRDSCNNKVKLSVVSKSKNVSKIVRL